MYPGSDPFGASSGDPFGSSSPPPIGYAGQPPNQFGLGQPLGGPGPQGDYNTFAVLAPIFGVIVPPVGVVCGHIALPQIARTHQRGRNAAISGMVLGYALSVVAVLGGVFALSGGFRSTPSQVADESTTSAAAQPAPTPSVVTSVAAPTSVPRVKLDLATVPLGTCVEIQIRSTESTEALDLFGVDCRHRAGVYTVAQRVGASYQCSSEFVASPPDRSFALCLNPY